MASSNVRVGVGCFITSGNHPNHILIGERKGSHGAGKLALPGGHLEVGEDWETCARREVKEETNLELDHVRFVHVTVSGFHDYGGDVSKHYITLFMTGLQSETSTELQNLEPHKCVGWKWITWNELESIYLENPSVLFDPLIHLIEATKQRPHIVSDIFQFS